MQATLTTSALDKALRTIQRLAPTENVRFHCEDGALLRLESSTRPASMRITLPTEELSGTCDFAISVDAFAKAIKGSDSVTLNYDTAASALEIKSGTTSIKLQSVDANPAELLPMPKDRAVKLGGDDARWLLDAIKRVSLKPTAALVNSTVYAAVSMSDKNTRVCCFDTSRTAFTATREVTGDLNVMLPVAHLQSAFEAMEGTKFALAVDDSCMYLASPTVLANISLPVPPDGLPEISQLMKLVGTFAASKDSASTIEVDRDACVSFMDKCQAVATKERQELRVTLAKGNCRLEVKSAAGQARTTFKAEGSAKFRIDMNYLQEAMSKNDSNEISVTENYIVLRGDTNVVVALNEDDGDDK